MQSRHGVFRRQLCLHVPPGLDKTHLLFTHISYSYRSIIPSRHGRIFHNCVSVHLLLSSYRTQLQEWYNKACRTRKIVVGGESQSVRFLKSCINDKLQKPVSFANFCVDHCTMCSLVMFCRSSLSNWSVGGQEAALQDVDYISFLFSTLTGFSSESLTSLQEAGDESALPPSPLSPLSLYPTPLEQFTHHWDVVEVRSLHTVIPPVTSYLTNILLPTFLPTRNTWKWF